MLGFTEEDIDKIIHDAAKYDVAIIDLFAGAGGTTCGAERAMFEGEKCCKVIACINHDRMALLSHAENNPDCIHLVEDIRVADITLIVYMVEQIRRLNPDIKIILWASLECTSHSRAKGGLSRDADSRTLSESLYSTWNPKSKKYTGKPFYIQLLKPDYIMIENVREFLLNGPLDDNGHPIKELEGVDYDNWRDKIKSLGYKYDYKFLNSADYGAYTSRIRYFGMFALPDLPIVFPQPTHQKIGKNGLKKWMAVKEVLDFSDEGYTIFNRKNNPDIPKRQRKELVEKTLERIYAGLVKYVAGGDTSFISKYNSGKPDSRNTSINEPCRVVTTENRHAFVQARFLSKNFSGHPESKNITTEGPSGTIKPIDNHSLIQATFLTHMQHSSTANSVEEPAPTLTTKDKLAITSMYIINPIWKSSATSLEDPLGTITASRRHRHYLVNANFIAQRNSGKPESKVSSVDNPARTLTNTGGNQDLITARFLANMQYKTAPQSIDSPAPTLVTKDRLVIVSPKFVPNFIMRDFTNGGQVSSVENPAGSVMPYPKLNLVSAKPFIVDGNYNNVGRSIDEPSPTLLASRRHHYILNPQWGGNNSSVEKPAPTLIAQMDKAPPYLVTTESGEMAIAIFETDSPMTKKIKEFMAAYGIIDIKMRMLKIPELLRIQDFGNGYRLKGNQTQQKKFIGNSVVPLVAQRWFESIVGGLRIIRGGLNDNSRLKVA